MRLTMFAFAVAVVALVVAPQAQSVVDGKWAVVFETPMGQIEATATFKTEGEKLTGSMQSNMGTIPLQGTVKESTIDFAMDTGEFSLTLTAAIDGDTLKGTFDASGQGGGTWSGTRMAPGR